MFLPKLDRGRTKVANFGIRRDMSCKDKYLGDKLSVRDL